MNNFYKFLRCAALMFLMMVWIMPAMAQHPFTLTTQEQHEAHSGEALYWIESCGATGFYAIPHTDNSYVSTTNMPNIKALWYFMDAGIENDIQYYYIVNHNTGRYLKLDGTLGNDNTIKLAVYDSGGDAFKFSIGGSEGQWVLYPKNGNGNYWVNKKGGNVSYSNYFKSSNYGGSPDANSKWNFMAKDDVTWAHPFTNSTNEEKHYYLIRNRHSSYTSYYMSTDASGYVTVSNVDNDNRIWYFEEASSDASIPNLKYYYIVNAATGYYMYFNSLNYNGLSSLSDVIKIQAHSGGVEDNYQFAIVNAKGTSYSAFAIMPKKLIGLYQNKYTSLGTSTMSNNERIDTRQDRGSDDNTAHWVIDGTTYSAVAAPTITNNFDGTISLNTTTPNAEIYYTLNNTEPSNSSTHYTSPFFLGNATVVKAIAYVGSDYSGVSTYNVPQCIEPTISFNSSTSKVTISDLNGGATIYYTTDGTTPTTSSATYSAPFTVASGTTVQAIAIHPGYLDSDVASKYILGNNYSQNYLTFEVLTSGVIPWKSIGTGMAKTISYRINGGSWESITAGSNTITVNAGDIVEIKGTNSTYAKDKSNYSGFDANNVDGAATYDISGNIMSLVCGDNYVGQTSLTDTYNFCSLFKQSKAVSAENLILPAPSLTDCCYRAMFSKCHTLEVAPALPATTLANYCYYYMFEECAITTAPELPAATLKSNCYGYMFTGCTSLNYINCHATTGFDSSNCLTNWVYNVSSVGIFVKDKDVNWNTGASGIPTNWTIYNGSYLYIPEISCDGEQITITCETEGASIYYRLNQTGDFSLYSSPIVFNATTTVEAYSTKDDNTSSTEIITFEKYDNPFDESTRSLDTWTYGNAQVTLPYSVNGIDGHSSNYSKGNHTFETTVTLYRVQPTYLWFQHADQSADIYVDNVFVTTHWGGYNAFFVDISDYVHQGTNHIKVILNNKTRDVLAPAAGDFNFNATLGKVKLLTSPIMPSMDYGYDGFHITSTVNNTSATINIKTSIPEGANVICKIDADEENYHFTETKASTGEEMTFTTTISNPRLWNGTIDPFLYDVTLEIRDNVNNELYHRYQRPYGFRYYEYDPSIGFLLNGSPYLLRGVCTHHDLEGKANALDDSDIANDFAIIKELGCNFLRLAHYPHPKEVYDWCDRLGIIVQTEVPCVNKFQNSLPQDYYDHLYIQYEDMVRQHYNHPCIMFWGLFNEATTDDTSIAKTRLEAYRTYIKNIDSERWVGYVVSHGSSNPSSLMGNPTMDWFGCNIYVGWYIDKDKNDPTVQLNSRKTNIITNLHKPLAFSEYGCGGTPSCHSDNFKSTTTTGNNPRHDIEYQMWLHEGHIAAIKNFPELLFTSQWQLFDIAVSSRNEGYTICPDGVNASIDNNLRYLNNKGLVERDHKTKKDTYYLYKAWWNQKDKFVHICGKDYEKLTGRVIKCYTNDGIITNDVSTLTLYVNNVAVETVTVEDNIATFTARNFDSSDVIRVNGATTHDAFTFTNDFISEGNWNEAANWRSNAVPSAGSDVVIRAECTIPNGVVVQSNGITIGENGSLTIADGGQLVTHSSGVNATVEKNIAAYTIIQNQGEVLSDGWYFIASPVNTTSYSTAMTTGSGEDYDLFMLDWANNKWLNKKVEANAAAFGDGFTRGKGYLYANKNIHTLSLAGEIQPLSNSNNATVSLTANGWNLIGNPLTCKVTVDCAFSELDNGSSVTNKDANSVINPCQGIAVYGEADEVVTFTKADLQNAVAPNNSSLQITLAKKITSRGELSNNVVDNAVVKFNESKGMPRFNMIGGNAKLYIPQNDEEYSVVFSDRQGDVPLNFKADEMGTYTITVETCHGASLQSVHLIDMLEEKDIDLGETPTYTFIGSPADRTARFKIVFRNVGDNGDNIFAYQNGSDIIVSGEGELQVFDVMGRMIATQYVNGVGTWRAASVPTGVYIFKLNEKSQKIVIR